MKIIGIDVSRGSITVCPLDKLPREFKRYRKGVEKIPLSRSGIKRLLELEPNGAVLEPTGGHYSKLWALRLKENGIDVRWVDHGAVDSYRRSHRCPNKSDLHDAVALACYGLEHWENEEYFIRPTRLELKEYCLQVNHLNHALTAVTNRFRQQLHHEWPEISKIGLARQPENKTPLVLRHIAGHKDSKRWRDMQAASIGTGISPFSRMLANQICVIQDDRASVEDAIEKELQRSEFKPYIQAMGNMGITAPKTMAALVCAVYPFERFLRDGRPIYEYVQTRSGKRSRRNRSKASFKLACGLGMVWYQSGDKQGFRPGGSADTRRALYLWVRMMIVIRGGMKGERDSNPFIREMQDYYRGTDGPGNQKVQKVARRVVERLFSELVKEMSCQNGKS
jgi:hypothetical protein